MDKTNNLKNETSIGSAKIEPIDVWEKTFELRYYLKNYVKEGYRASVHVLQQKSISNFGNIRWDDIPYVNEGGSHE